jgi:hypothetical protein
MFINIQTSAFVRVKQLILKLLRHVSVFLHHFQVSYRLCQLKLRIMKMIKYNTVLYYAKMLVNVAANKIQFLVTSVQCAGHEESNARYKHKNNPC